MKGFNRDNTNEKSGKDINGAMKKESMQLTMLSDTGTLKKLRIPATPEGKYGFEDLDEESMRNLIFVMPKNGEWHICCQYPISFMAAKNGQAVRSNDIALENNQLISVENAKHKCVIYIENINQESSVFHNYIVTKNSPISIGRLDDNDISYPNALVSRHHAEFGWTGNSWYIRDLGSSNGVFVNDVKINEKVLHTGDVIYILGLRIIIGTDFIAINDGNGRVKVSDNKMIRADSSISFGVQPSSTANMNKDDLFNRLPREKTALVTPKIVVEAPPMSLNSNQIPLMLRMGGSMVNGGVAALSGHYTSLLSSVLFPVLTQKYTEKEKKEYEASRVEKYGKYLESKKDEIKNEVLNEQRLLNKSYPEVSELLNYPFSKTKLWERRKIDDDFLNMRLGSGSIPLIAEIDYPDQRFNMNEDELEDKMYSLVEKQVFLEDVPIVMSLCENIVSGVTGRRDKAISLAKNLVMQTVLLHGYDEVKTVFLIEPEELNEMEYIKYIPHAWDDQRTIRFIATNSNEAYQIGEYIKREVEPDLEKTRKLKDILKTRPYYVIFAFSKRILDSIEIVKDIMQKEENCGMSIIAVFDDLPKECSIMLDLNADGTDSVVYLNQPERDRDTFKLDDSDNQLIEKSMREMSNISLKMVSQAYSLPKTVTFLEMFGVGRIEHLNPLKRWSENNPVKSLSTPIGVATDGSLFCLDLHQKFQGPHGLVAGMTGSGKSEFLLTYILSMAVNYSPDEVAFVLIDYKGGGLAGAFDDPDKGIHLPHLVGTITNLDGATIQRSIMSIQSELMRRQRVFNDAKSLSDEGTMDIYKYQRLYRNNVVSEPMPHLFIVSDEFAELKQQQPEFMDQLISVARIGRSLGVHLVLATQKPAGIVNEQIRSNTKFRVCLKVQDKSDSMDMLKRAEAAELKDTGRFYLQVGYNEFFALGQSAWCGADYIPEDEVVIQLDDSVQFIDSVGSNILEIKPKSQKGDACGTQLVAVVKMLSNIAKENNIRVESLWKPQLPERINLDDIRDSNSGSNNRTIVKTNIGILDDPNNQNQFILDFDFTHCQNLMIVGEPGSGKTTLIQSILYSLARDYTPQEVNFYVFDYSSRLLKLFKPLNHCGGVFTEDDADSLGNIFELLGDIVAERKKLFAELEVDNFDAACSIKQIPLILVAIDNFAGLSATKKGDVYAARMQAYIKEGCSYGIKYIISCNYSNELNSRMKQEIGDHICLQMKDRYEYSETLGCKTQYVPPECPGRGMYNYDGVPLELHVAMVFANDDDRERIQLLKHKIEEIKDECKDSFKAKRLTEISETISYTEFLDEFEKGRIPLGYSTKSGKKVSLPFKQFSTLSLYFGNKNGILPTWQNLVEAAEMNEMDIYAVKPLGKSAFEQQQYIGTFNLIDCKLEAITGLYSDLIEIIKDRRALLIEYCESNGLDAKRKDIYTDTFDYMLSHTTPIFILVENFYDFCNITDDDADKAFTKIIQLSRQYNIYFAAGFYPAENIRWRDIPLYSLFNKDMILMYGGKFDKQPFVDNRTIIQVNNVLPYNRCVMYYRESLFEMLMPCGELKEEEEAEDDKSIF